MVAMITDGDFIADRRPVRELFPGDVTVAGTQVQLILHVPLGTKGPDCDGWFDCPASYCPSATYLPSATDDPHRLDVLGPNGIIPCMGIRIGPKGFVIRSDGIWDSPVR